MSQTLTKILLHIVFSTRNRESLIPHEVEERLFSYLGGVCRNLESPLLAAGGTSDHVHLLVHLSKKVSVVQLLLNVKRDSSAWFKSVPGVDPAFAWQDGYAAFSVGESQVEVLRNYFAKQREHHRVVSFQDEFRELLRKCHVDFDERHVWQ